MPERVYTITGRNQDGKIVQEMITEDALQSASAQGRAYISREQYTSLGSEDEEEAPPQTLISASQELNRAWNALTLPLIERLEAFLDRLMYWIIERFR